MTLLFADYVLFTDEGLVIKPKVLWTKLLFNIIKHQTNTTFGDKDTPNTPGGSSVPLAAHSAVKSHWKEESFPSFNSLVSSLPCQKETPERGMLLGIVRPVWRKVVESEVRLAWLNDMVREKLVVRDINSYAKSISACLRSEEMIIKEEEADLLARSHLAPWKAVLEEKQGERN